MTKTCLSWKPNLYSKRKGFWFVSKTTCTNFNWPIGRSSRCDRIITTVRNVIKFNHDQEIIATTSGLATNGKFYHSWFIIHDSMRFDERNQHDTSDIQNLSWNWMGTSLRSLKEEIIWNPKEIICTIIDQCKLYIDYTWNNKRNVKK